MTTPLISRVVHPDSLSSAWEKVQEASATDDDVSGSVARFRPVADERLAQLAQALAEQTYRPKPLAQVEIPKPTEGFRVLDVPPVIDRIVERSLLDVVAPYVDPVLGASAFGYRPGLGVVDAVQRLVLERENGQRCVLRTDVADCFPTLPRDLAVGRLTALLPDDSLTWVIALLTARRTNTRRGLREVPGLPQGTALSPLLCNLVLAPVDHALADHGFHAVRFADDIAVPCSGSDEASAALRIIKSSLKEIGMTVNQEKTEVTSFDQGFCFLGEDFGPTYPPLVAELRVEEPLARVLYVGLQGGRVRVQAGRIVVTTKDDVEALNVPSSHVSRLVLFGSVGLTAGARSWLLGQAVDIVFLSCRGSYLGVANAASSALRAQRLKAQIATAEDPERAMRFGRSVVQAKIRHQITLVQRFSRPDIAEDLAPDLELMRAMVKLAPGALSRDEVMGVEGAAAKAYFRALAKLLPPEVGFSGRTRQPPLDIVNAALGYTYAILLGECVSAIVASGLEPAIGLIHADSERRPSLALDLMEEFRPYVADQVVVSLVRRKSLTAEHGREKSGESGVWLTKAGKNLVVDAYERRMLQVTGGAMAGFTGTLRRHVYRQAQKLARYVQDPETDWIGLSWR
ncbi:MAG: CRISPR-associated endonuclease Cas1 [Propionibacteriaceae bacterium]|nr:CRISPR-associated endonuclease Cas1 [Propionibacteriaceae bacterium]